jgi:hypothetical protein
MIGGYALRAFVPFSRSTRDCDFAMTKRDGWNIDRIKDIIFEGKSILRQSNYGEKYIY